MIHSPPLIMFLFLPRFSPTPPLLHVSCEPSNKGAICKGTVGISLCGGCSGPGGAEPETPTSMIAQALQVPQRPFSHPCLSPHSPQAPEAGRAAALRHRVPRVRAPERHPGGQRDRRVRGLPEVRTEAALPVPSLRARLGHSRGVVSTWGERTGCSKGKITLQGSLFPSLSVKETQAEAEGMGKEASQGQWTVCCAIRGAVEHDPKDRSLSASPSQPQSPKPSQTEKIDPIIQCLSHTCAAAQSGPCKLTSAGETLDGRQG